MNSQRPLWLGLGFCIVLAALATWFEESRPLSQLTKMSKTSTDRIVQTQARPQAAEVPSKNTSPSTAETTAETPSDALAIPSEEQYRKETEADPEGTPPSLFRFADQLSIQMEKALQSEPDAQALYPKLAECALSEQTPPTVQATCASNLFRLAKLYPETFLEKAKALQEKLSPRVKLLTQAAGYELETSE